MKSYLVILFVLSFLFVGQIDAEEVYLISRESTIREKIEATFWDSPKMMDIIGCESGFQQFKDGKPLRSGTSDIGVMQINQVHWQEAKKLGLDIFNSASDNIRMGRIILEKQGISAWVCNRLV